MVVLEVHLKKLGDQSSPSHTLHLTYIPSIKCIATVRVNRKEEIWLCWRFT